MVRLTVVSQTAEEAVLRMAGWLEGSDIEVLKLEGKRCLSHSKSLLLDLSGVRSIDQAGMGLLRVWSQNGVSLSGGSLFLRALLKAHGLEQEEELK